MDNIKKQANSFNTGQYYLGIKNPAAAYGVNVSIEVVAITAKNDYVMSGNQTW
jgi:hypothetical protein